MHLRENTFEILRGADSPAHTRDQVENQREHNAKDDRSDDGEVNNRILAAINNIAGQAAEGQIGASGQDQNQTEQNEEAAGKNQEFAELTHPFILVRARLVACSRSEFSCGPGFARQLRHCRASLGTKAAATRYANAPQASVTVSPN